MNQTEPGISATVTASTDSLRLDYVLSNDLDVPILVFDWLYSLANQALMEDWHYAQFNLESLTLARKVWELPRGLAHQNPQVPYARKVEPGQVVSGQLRVQLPVQETNPYYGIVHRNDREVDVAASRIQFQLGWTPATDLPEIGWMVVNDADVFLFDYYTAIARQKVATTAPMQADVHGISRR